MFLIFKEHALFLSYLETPENKENPIIRVVKVDFCEIQQHVASTHDRATKDGEEKKRYEKKNRSRRTRTGMENIPKNN